MEKKYSKTLIVRITPVQYTRLLETIIKQRKNGTINSLKPLEKSIIIREMIDKYTS
jgi:hypothetical protein